MDRQKVIAYLSETQEDQVLLAKVLDKMQAGERRNIPVSTNFLTGREQLLAKELLRQAGIAGVHAFGGVPDPERSVLCYVPEYYDATEFLYSPEGPVAALRAEISSYDSLTHRDFLGSILAQGIKREILGDIYVSEQHCDFLVTREMSDYLSRNVVSVGRAKVSVHEIALSEISVPEKRTKVIRDTVASLRLDSVMASGFQIGRSKAQTFISAGKTEVNHLPYTKADRLIEAGDVISVRGLGKVRVSEVGGLTKKGRIGITLEKYI